MASYWRCQPLAGRLRAIHPTFVGYVWFLGANQSLSRNLLTAKIQISTRLYGWLLPWVCFWLLWTAACLTIAAQTHWFCVCLAKLCCTLLRMRTTRLSSFLSLSSTPSDLEAGRHLHLQETPPLALPLKINSITSQQIRRISILQPLVRPTQPIPTK